MNPDDNDISDIWMGDSNIWQVNESYIAETTEYFWYAIAILDVFYILNRALI